MRAAWQYYNAWKGKRQYVKCFFVEIGKNIFLVTFFRNLKFPELENWKLEVPGTW